MAPNIIRIITISKYLVAVVLYIFVFVIYFPYSWHVDINIHFEWGAQIVIDRDKYTPLFEARCFDVAVLPFM